MARGIKLTDSVSISELMHMREVEGLSNGEIARRLDVHINTICNAIGPHPDGKRAKRKRPTRTAEKLPALPEKQIPDIPRESFKERCERLMAKELEAEADANIASHDGEYRVFKRGPAPEPVAKIIFPAGEPKEADKARAAHEEAMKEIRPAPMVAEPVKPEPLTAPIITPYTSYKEPEEKPSCIHELLAVFGADTVRSYLRVALYAWGNPYVNLDNRDDMVKALKVLNGEAICVD